MAGKTLEPNSWPGDPAGGKKRQGRIKACLTVVLVLGLLAFQGRRWLFPVWESKATPLLVASAAQCPAQPVLRPNHRPDITERNIEQIFRSARFRDHVGQRLSGAVKVPSISYDGMGKVGEDRRWDIFYELGDYLRSTFPLIYEHFEVSTVNEHGLLYTWSGSDASLKPLLFMAHQDVVPVSNSTLSRWTYPPFSGHYDGEFVWGRGSEDDKSTLIAVLSAMTALLEADFIPARTVILAVGFDEEGGYPESYGAKALSNLLEKKYGADSMEMIFDEGVAGIETHFGTEFAGPATAEKGYVDITVTVETSGGHSSTPPDHTAIGYLAEIISLIERNPFPSTLTSGNPTGNYLSCLAEYGETIPSDLKDAILDRKDTRRVIDYMEKSLDTRALIRTSSAIDVVHGGSKANNLPDSAYILVNHRIAVDQSVQAVKDYYIDILTPLSEKLNFTLCGFSENKSCISSDSTVRSKILLESSDELEPSPSSDPSDPRFGWLTGTLRGVFGEEVIVSPVLLTGNTDTKYYWNLSSQIYRMAPWRAERDPRGTNMHTVDERMPVAGLLEMITFFHEFIRVVDESRR
ncbi:peptidase family M20/M25/M40 [Phlyctema vagabunda]|uniref:Peptidase family M20/M25/M40 n=1 Tax=Phlyctema vagabunda TaxID=108571 RepID=A0ABR4PHW1_9HELO